MRLLRVHTLKFVEYADEREVPRYGMLSHRWEGQEESYNDMISGRAEQRNGYGYRKIREFCKQCASRGLPLAWVDTCCIDKSSSAELSEAINSMYRWYRNAAVCLVYLVDVTAAGRETIRSYDASAFVHSNWFDRGWTLQELIAPETVFFYDRYWRQIGSKQELSQHISRKCGIPENVLHGEDPRNYSIAQRMSWAAKRSTTRIEDEAYSLLGLFDVHMPMLYGEGHRAFIRLQEEIIRRSSDQSIFAWPGIMSEYEKSEMYDTTFRQLEGLLATSVAAFALCGNIAEAKDTSASQSISVTNLGLSLNLPLRSCDLDKYEARLNCRLDTKLFRSNISIYLRQTKADGQFVRDTFNNSLVSSWVPNETSGQTAQTEQREINVIQGNSSLAQTWSTTIVATANREARDRFSSENGWNREGASILEQPDITSGKPVMQLSANVGMGDPYTLTISLSFDFDFNPLLLVRLRAGIAEQWDDPYPLSTTNQRSTWDSALHRLVSESYLDWNNDNGADPDSGAENLYERDRQWTFSGHRSEGILAWVRQFNLAINVQRKDFVRANVWTIDIQKADPSKLHFLGRMSRSSPAELSAATYGTPASALSLADFWRQADSPTLAKDRCCICQSLMVIPLVTTCAHTFCQVCTHWIDINFTSVDLQPALDLGSHESLHDFQWGKDTLCPICSGYADAAVDWQRQEEIHEKYPTAFKLAYWSGQPKIEDAFPAFETITLNIGNTHKLTRVEHEERERQNRHDWTFFVRPSHPSFVAEISIYLHPTFRPHVITLTKQPFEIRRFGWGTFEIRAKVILKPGYTFLHDAAEDEDGEKRVLDLFWTLGFDGDGGQGRLKAVVQRSKRVWSENDQGLQQQIERLRSLQRAAYLPVIMDRDP